MSGPEVSINETSDVKLQFSFGNSLLAPWVPIYDSKKREVIESLIITFYTDKYNLRWQELVHPERPAPTKKKRKAEFISQIKDRNSSLIKCP